MIFKNLNTTILRITTRYNNLYSYDVNIEENGLHHYTFKGGFAAEMFYNLQVLLGFDYIFIPDVGTYNFSLASERLVDLFVGSYSLFHARAKVVDPTFVTGNSKIIAVINHEHESNEENIFILPFSTNLWFGIFSLFLSCFLVVLVMGWIQKCSWQDSLFQTVAVILQKECSIMCSNGGFRIAFFCISTPTIVILACYTGNMFSMKAINRFAINSMESLIGSHYKVLLELGENDSPVLLMLEALVHIPVVSKLLNRIHSANYIYTTFGDAMKQVLQHPTAYIIDEETAMTSIGEEIGQFPCTWTALSVFNLKYPWSMYMRKNSPYKDSINYGLLRIDETGLQWRLRKRWIPQASQCKATSMPFTTIRINQVYFALAIYAIGLLLSVLVYIFSESKYIFPTIFRMFDIKNCTK